MVRPADVVVLLALQRIGPDWTLRSVADRLGVQHSKVQRAVDRLQRAGLYDARRRVVIPHAADEFLLHALKYLHPIREGAPTRGVPTAWAALPLSQDIAASSELPPVWPDPHGTVRGLAVEPLDESLPRLAVTWPEVAEMAALLDALRLGDARVREVATRHLHERLAATA
jgi:DNA-binding transcriptional MocR family regulator